jgi:hypothetical protein
MILINSVLKDNEVLISQYKRIICNNNNTMLKSIVKDIVKEKLAQKKQLMELISSEVEDIVTIDREDYLTISNVITYESNIQSTYFTILRSFDNTINVNSFSLIVLSQNFVLQMLNHLFIYMLNDR